jgi:hypothetical protein
LVHDKAFIGSVRHWLETKDIAGFRAGEHAPMNEAKERVLDEMMTEVEHAVLEFKEDCKTDLTSRDAIKDHVTRNGSLHVNDAHLTHAIRRAGMTNTSRRVRYRARGQNGQQLVEVRHRVVIVRGALTAEGRPRTRPC